MDMSCFLKEVGLDHDDVPVHLGASPHALELSMKSKSSTYQSGSPTKHYVQVEELPELIFYDQVHCISFSPCVSSPKSVKPQYISWPDDGVLDFALLWNTYPFKALMDTTFNSRITRNPLKYICCSHRQPCTSKIVCFKKNISSCNSNVVLPSIKTCFYSKK